MPLQADLGKEGLQYMYLGPSTAPTVGRHRMFRLDGLWGVSTLFARLFRKTAWRVWCVGGSSSRMVARTEARRIATW